jgi:hypothetical protein
VAREVGAGACPDLRHVDVWSVTAEGATPLADGIRSGRVPRLERLALMGPAIDDARVVALVEALQASPCRSFRSLSLYDVGMNVEGCRALAQAMREAEGVLSRLTELTLKVQDFGDEGALALAEALEAGAGASLTRLDLSHDDLHKDTLARLRAAVPEGCPVIYIGTVHGGQ